jgi:hypothetical protein
MLELRCRHGRFRRGSTDPSVSTKVIVSGPAARGARRLEGQQPEQVLKMGRSSSRASPCLDHKDHSPPSGSCFGQRSANPILVHLNSLWINLRTIRLGIIATPRY